MTQELQTTLITLLTTLLAGVGGTLAVMIKKWLGIKEENKTLSDYEILKGQIKGIIIDAEQKLSVGADKLKYALDYLESWATDKGIEWTTELRDKLAKYISRQVDFAKSMNLVARYKQNDKY